MGGFSAYGNGTGLFKACLNATTLDKAQGYISSRKQDMVENYVELLHLQNTKASPTTIFLNMNNTFYIFLDKKDKQIKVMQF
ncbi:hypothetical protein ACFSKU_07185 [Pontibacter silvestris]|uniref:Uncharacterized protein n=1 Tax=Pontibacter silvestris TaxID=2305183 RepID=A0ABW4WV82_9BACT|nr:hypothetical protein [Pontibacter silvestris]MCC9136574.1 hypothetical protein [Pontibacter silvestris]